LATVAITSGIAAEVVLQAHSASLFKELGFANLVFASILLVVIPDFFQTAIRAGPARVVL
jgi:hypothetical protein